MNRVPLNLGQPTLPQRKVFEAFRRGARFVYFQAGRQSGKSVAGARFLLSEVAAPGAGGNLHVAASPTYRMARVVNRKLQEILKANKSLWKRIKYRAQPLPTYEFPNGDIIEVHSADDPESLRGLTAKSIWFDENALASYEAFRILLPTLLATGGRYLGTSTGRGKKNWTYEALFLKGLEPGHPEYNPSLINPLYATVLGTTMDNVMNLSEDAISELKSQYGEGSLFYRQEILGESVSYEGLVYKWDETVNYLPPGLMPKPEEYSIIVGAIDFGFHPDPFAAVVLGYKDGIWYVPESVKLERATIADMSAELSHLSRVWGVNDWIADSARPDTINELRLRGLPVRPVIKPEIMERVAELSAFTDKNRLKVSWAAPDVVDELGKYSFPEKDARNQNPIDKFNHFLDAVGYAVWTYRYLWRTTQKHKVTEPEDDEHPVDKLLGRKRRSGRRYGAAGLYGPKR